MAKKILTLPWTMSEIKTFADNIVATFTSGFWSWINRMKTKPFVIVTDEEKKCKRIFLTEEDAETYFNARLNQEMTEEIAALDFTGGTIPGDEQYKMTFNVQNPEDASTYGTKVYLRFNFATADTLNNNKPIGESISVFFSFEGDSGTRTLTKRFAYSEKDTAFDVTDYIEAGENNIVMTVTGLTTGLSLTAKATYTAVYLPFESSFDISAERKVGLNFGIHYKVSGSGTKTIEFVIDGEKTYKDTVYDGSAVNTYQFINNLSAGFHTLQMKAFTTIYNVTYESNMLYFEFVVKGTGLDLTTTLISAVFDSGTSYFSGNNPGLIGEQYVDYTLNWAYFSTSKSNAEVIWKTKLNDVEKVVGSREIDEISGKNGVIPDPVTFQPDSVGNYKLYAYIKDDETTHIGEYTINVIANTAGLREDDSYIMKLEARGRSNDEPTDTRSDWSNNGFKTTFNEKMTFDGLAGWTSKALRLDNGATAINTCKPFATERSILTNGGSIVFYFKTFNVEDETVPLIEIGDPDAISTAYFAIYGKKVVFKPSSGDALEYQFASEEDTHLAVVVNPKKGSTDEQMMFFIFNGIEAPGSPYANTAVFNIGSNDDTSSTDGMIKMGNADGKAAIDIYGIRVYNSALTMWYGMMNYIIDKGGDVASLMNKNNIFTDNDFNKPIISTIKDNYRVLEVIGDLGMLEESSTKVSFFGSVKYTDPFNPEYDFYRTDGGAYIETAGQSRLVDLMAKSFHLDLNQNETVALYQDGKLCHKNRFIFAKGNIPENGVRIDMCGADSSICRNASHMKLVNKYYQNIKVNTAGLEYSGYVLRTPAQNYAYEQWSSDMAAKWGGNAGDYPWPYNINIAPDAVPIVVVWHKTENDSIQVYGLACMTEEKKASYANGNHSIYLKEMLEDGTFDPYDRYTGKNGSRGWNNEGVEEMEFVNPTDLTNFKDTSTFNDSTARGNSFELCYPKKKDLTEDGAEEKVWQTFLTEFIKPIADTYGDQTAFDAVVESVIYMPSFAMYYNKCLDRKMNDSLCRNMHVLRLNYGTEESPKWRWYAKWWDADVSVGLFQSNAMGVDPTTDRQTKDANGDYVMAGHDVWLWNALENNETFNKWCYALAEASFEAGWSASTDKEMQDSITDGFSESLYNLDGLIKFLSAYRNGNDYMIRMQGNSIPFRHGFTDDSYFFRESVMAIGSYADDSISFRPLNASYPQKVKLSTTVEWRFGLGATTSKLVTGIIIKPEDGEVGIELPETAGKIARDFLYVYGASKIKTLDISEFAKQQINTITVNKLTQVQKFYVGYKTHEDLTAGGINQSDSVAFAGLDAMSRLTEFSIMGLHGLKSKQIDLSSLNHLTTLYASGTGLTSFNPADGTKFTTLELPDTLESIEAKNVTLGDITFWEADLDNNTLTEIDTCPTSLLELELIGMGVDEGTHTLLHKWLQMLAANPTLINKAQIECGGITWTDVEKADLLTLTQIPSGQRNVTGYVCVKDGQAYTAAERQTLQTAFGTSCFDITAKTTTLVCDGPGNGISISISGDSVVSASETAASIVQGHNATLTGSSFPLSGGVKYIWRVYYNGKWNEGSDDLPLISFGTNSCCSINRLTGEITTTEDNCDTMTYRVGCFDAVAGRGSNGEISLTINPRTYPTNVTTYLKSAQSDVTVMNGEIQITDIGIYKFAATHKRIVNDVEEDYSGTMKLNGGVWTMVTDDTTNLSHDTSSESDANIEFSLKVSSMPSVDESVTIKYTSTWKNNLQLTADDIKIAIVPVIEQLLVDDPVPNGNDILYDAVEAYGITPAKTGHFTSVELKQVVTDFSVKTLLPSAYTSLVSLYSGEYFIPQYLKNVYNFDFSDCTGLSGNIDFSAVSWADKLDLSGCIGLSLVTIDGVSLHTLVTKNMSQMTEIQLTTTNTTTITSEGTMPSVYVEDDKVSTYRSSAGDAIIEPLSDIGKDCLMWDDGTRMRFDDESTMLL